MGDELELRISDAEREQAVASLRDHAVAGRLTLDELSDRIDAAYGARTAGELRAVTNDLPTAVRPSRRRPVSWTVAVIGQAARTGRWRVAPKTRVVLGIGECILDLREAEISADEVTITIAHGIGDTKVFVPEGVDVELSGLMLIGNKKQIGTDPPSRPGRPLVRVRVLGFIGEAKVIRTAAD